MSPTRPLELGLMILVISGFAVGVVAALDLTPSHEHTSHEYNVEDVAYDEEHDIVWSVDNNLTADSVTFVGYDVAAEEVVVEESFSSGHAIADGQGVVYIAENNQLWQFDVESRETTLLTELAHHPGAMKYDEARNLIWVGQAGDVVAFDAADGEEVMRHGEHGEGRLASLSVQGQYVASVRVWEPDPIVYDIENEAVAFEPLPESIADKEDGNIVSVHLTRSGEVILGGGWDSVFMYDIASEELEAQYAAHAFGAHEVRYLESRNLIISTGFGNRVAFYDVEAGSLVRTYDHGDTIFAADLDRENEIIWYGDGEDPPDGTITGLQMEFEESDSSGEKTTSGADSTGEATAGETESEPPMTTAAATEGDQSAGPAEATTTSGMDETATPTDSEGQPGLGVVSVIAAVAVVLLISRFRTR